MYDSSLPLPWLLWNMANSGGVENKDGVLEYGLSVSSAGAACSITMLFLMLVIVFLAILAFKWQMTKTMGGVMVILYGLFVIISLGFSFEWYKCPV